MAHASTPLPGSLLAQAIPMLTRHELASLAERLLERLDSIDEADGHEPDGDEEDGTIAEDDFCRHRSRNSGPGCPVADPDCAIDDCPCDDDFDREPEEGTIAHYGMDQSRGPVGPCSDTEPVW